MAQPAPERIPPSHFPYGRPPPERPRLVVRRPGPSTPLTMLLLGALTAAGAALRLWNSAGQSLRLDEGFSIRWAAAPLSPVMQGKTVAVRSLFQVTAGDVHPPGYFLFLHVWMQAFGTNLAMLRLPGEVAGILAVPAVYLLATSLYPRTVGLFAALLTAFSPFLIWHAQEARMYPFLLLFTVLSTYGLVRGLRGGRAWGWLMFGVCSLLAIYTQYYAFLVLLAQGIFVLLHWRTYTLRQILTPFAIMALVGVAYVPWVLTFLANYHGASDPSLAAPTLYTPFNLLSAFLFGYLSLPVTSNVIAAWPLLIVAGLLFGTFAGAMNRRAALLWLLFLVPILAALAITLTVRPFLSVRYLVVSVPALYILLAVTFDRLPGRAVRIFLAAALVGISLGAWRIEETSALNPQAEDYRSAVQYINAHAQPGDVVALDSFYNQDAFSYYSRLNLPVYDFPLAPDPVTGKVPRMSPAAFDSYLSGIAAGRSRLWVLYYLESNYDPGNVVRNYLAYHTTGHRVIIGGPYGRNDPAHPNSSINVQLVVYSLIPRPAQILQIRPETTQELRGLSAVSPTLRDPFASPNGAPGAQAPLIGPPLAPTVPQLSWTFPALATLPNAAWLTLFNPNPHPVGAVVTGYASGTTAVTIPAARNVEIRLADLGAYGTTQSLTIGATDLISATRTVYSGGTGYLQNAFRPAAASPTPPG